MDRRNFLHSTGIMAGSVLLQPLLSGCANQQIDPQSTQGQPLNVEKVVAIAEQGGAILDITAFFNNRTTNVARWLNWQLVEGQAGAYGVNTQLNFGGLRSERQNANLVHPLERLGHYTKVPLWTMDTAFTVLGNSLMQNCLINDPNANQAIGQFPYYSGVQNTDSRMELGILDGNGIGNYEENVFDLFSKIQGRPYNVPGPASFQSGPMLNRNGILLPQSRDGVLKLCS